MPSMIKCFRDIYIGHVIVLTILVIYLNSMFFYRYVLKMFSLVIDSLPYIKSVNDPKLVFFCKRINTSANHIWFMQIVNQ